MKVKCLKSIFDTTEGKVYDCLEINQFGFAVIIDDVGFPWLMWNDPTGEDLPEYEVVKE